MSHFLDNLIAFGRLLRQQGLAVDTGRIIDLAAALPQLDLTSRDDVHAACRALLVQRLEDFSTFDRLFDLFWSSPAAADVPHDTTRRSEQGGSSDSGAATDRDTTFETELTGTALIRTWSDVEAIASRDFATLTPEELAAAGTAMATMAWRVGERRTRRWMSGRGSRIDMRRALAASLRTGGEVITLPRRQRRVRTRPVVLLCDVSGSMALYSRTLLHFSHSLIHKHQRVEAFLFATRLTRITSELRSPTPDAAMTAVSHAVRDWSGGTRIGDALRTFHQRWRRRVLHGDAIVILISDGWDRGDPALLRDEIARLQRSCHHLVWLNPLIGSADYAPLTRGLQAALPHVDAFLPVRTLRDVRDLALHLGAIQPHGRHRLVHLRGAATTRVGSDARSRGHRRVHPGV